MDESENCVTVYEEGFQSEDDDNECTVIVHEEGFASCGDEVEAVAPAKRTKESEKRNSS
jgi:hypothetical protein